jgi:GNAT superfamily N-acetyltransferase
VILRAEPDDDAQRACHEIHTAAQAVDDPGLPAMSFPAFAKRAVSGDADGASLETWLGDRAYLTIWLPKHENTQMALCHVTVHPDSRRHGTGTEFLAFAERRCGELGRGTMATSAWVGSPGDEFCRSAGFVPGQTEVRRVMPVGAVPPVRLADGYSLVSWTGATPPGQVDQVAILLGVLADAPRDEGREPERWDAERVRRMDKRTARLGMREHTVAALAPTGEMAALTQIGVAPDRPEWGWQQLTSVVRAHRGHGLGLAVKSAMLGYLVSAEPRLRQILTWNAEANEHMIAINEAMGYRVFGVPGRSWERKIT